MAVLIGTLLGVLVIGVVLYPFIKLRFRPEGNPTRHSRATGPPRALRGRDAIYEEIRSLQQDYESGSMEEAEYHERLRAYRLQAAGVLRDQEVLQRELHRAHEEEIMAARTVRVEKSSSFCRSCGQLVVPGNADCSNCGAALHPEKPEGREGVEGGDAQA